MPSYTDIDFLLTRNILTNDCNIKIDQSAVSQSIKNIISTSKNEKLFSPNFGGNIYDLLFSEPSRLQIELQKVSLYAALSIYEKRATATNINIIDSGLGYWIVSVEYFLVVSPEQKAQITFTV